MTFSFKVTTHGRAILAACADLEAPLKLTRAAVGSGRVGEDVELADVHELLRYVAEASIGERRHEDDRLYLSVQYSNDAASAGVETFMLSEFMIYALDPETGEERDFIYASLGDYSPSVPSYREGFAPGTWTFPITMVVSDEIQVDITAPAGLVTHDDLQYLLNEGVIGISRTEIDIPHGGWTQGGGPEDYPYCIDIPITGAKSRMTPIVTIYPKYLAGAYGLCPTSETLDGAVRLYAMTPPSAVLKASVALVGGAGYIGHGGGGGDIAPATRNALGGVIVGDGLNVDFNGKISVDKDSVMTDEDLADDDEVMKDVAEILENED